MRKCALLAFKLTTLWATLCRGRSWLPVLACSPCTRPAIWSAHARVSEASPRRKWDATQGALQSSSSFFYYTLVTLSLRGPDSSSALDPGSQVVGAICYAQLQECNRYMHSYSCVFVQFLLGRQHQR